MVKLTNYGFLVKKKIHQKNQAEKKIYWGVERTGKDVFPGPTEILVEWEDLCYKRNGSENAGEDGKMQRSKIRAGLAVAALAWLLLLGFRGPDLAWSQGGGSASIFQSYAKPLPLPDFSLEDLQGKAVQIQAFKGKVILLNFWATW
jgi:hypothetical protein